MTTWRIIGLAAVPVTAIAIGAGSLIASAAPATEPVARPAAVLVEDDACGTPAAAPAATPHAAAPAATATGTATIHVTIPPVAWLELDEAGRLMAAATNTGCAPRTGDTVVARRPDRTLVAKLTVDLADVVWVGDFTRPAVLVPQTDRVVIGR